jgi:hypothetical protein
MSRGAALVGVAVATTTLHPAATPAANPDISVIGDTRASWSETADEVELSFEELEVGFVGPVNPYASAEVFVAVHGTSDFEIEEAKLILDRYFPGGFGLTVGHFLLDFGQLNQVHAHAYPLADRALMHTEFFGADGVVDTGARLDWLAPVDAVTLRATAGAVRGDVFLAGGHGHAVSGVEEPVEVNPKIGVSGRVEIFAEPSRDFSFLVGASVLHGQHDPVDGALVTFVGADAKARLDLGPGRALVVNAEGVLASRDATEEVPASDPNGFFVSVDLRASRRWNFGGFAESSTRLEDDEMRIYRYGGFLGLALMEESTLFRLVGRGVDRPGESPSGEVVVQAVFGLGPHRTHRY